MYDHERSLVKEMQNRPFALIGVNSDDNLEEIRRIVKEKHLIWRSFQNSPEGSKSAISSEWNVRGWPTIVVLDEERKIHYRGHDGNEAMKMIKKMVADLEEKRGGTKL